MISEYVLLFCLNGTGKKLTYIVRASVWNICFWGDITIDWNSPKISIWILP